MCIRDTIARNMHLIRFGSLKKPERFSSFVRNASFSSGWLHLVVQGFFAVFTVASFILIVKMSIPKYPDLQPIPDRHKRCYAKNCMVLCEEVPYFGQYEEDILYATSMLPETCTGFYLSLHRPMFVNGTLPVTWLPRFRLPINELSLVSGNLQHLPRDAFLSQYAAAIRILELHGLDIETWQAGSLVGLNSLRQIYIKKCTFDDVDSQALSSVQDTLQSLTITQSDEWNPANFTRITQFRNLATVDFSHNIFHDILGRNSFTGIKNCKVLYLNSCRITMIGLGAFDHFYQIEMLFLNDNNLITISAGLFSNIMSLNTPKPRINLHDNMWRCSCKNFEINQLVIKDMLDTDPSCIAPDEHKGKTFTEFQKYCLNGNKSSSNTVDMQWSVRKEEIPGIFYVNNVCNNGNVTSPSPVLKVLSPLDGHRCGGKVKINRADLNRYATRNLVEHESDADWLKFYFFFKTDTSNMIQIRTADTNKYGLIWYHSGCPNEVNCVSVFPSALRIYNINETTDYILCPVLLNAGTVVRNMCIYNNMTTLNYKEIHNNILQILLIVSTGGICLVFGALIVYAVVRKYPSLLKGSKRILFVKHKTVDALVLPPKVPARNNLVNEVTSELDEKKIFIVPTNFDAGKFKRSKSTRSNKSNAPSYISALHPTEDQLENWRTINQSTNDVTSKLSTYSWICNADPAIYTDLIDDKTYESLK